MRMSGWYCLGTDFSSDIPNWLRVSFCCHTAMQFTNAAPRSLQQRAYQRVRSAKLVSKTPSFATVFVPAEMLVHTPCSSKRTLFVLMYKQQLGSAEPGTVPCHPAEINPYSVCTEAGPWDLHHFTLRTGRKSGRNRCVPSLPYLNVNVSAVNDFP